MHIHILGVCGTFMGSLALLAKAKGHRVTGCDLNVYPPMSTQLENAGIELIHGFAPEQTDLAPDVFVIGNVVSRGNRLMEAILDRGLPYTSGPQWLHEHLLQNKWVLAVAGTHGKTTTTSMLAWILEHAGMQPGFLIGGVPGNFTESARLGGSDFFVIEADEYDTAFFDKRSKFVHYRPRTLVINNLEYDHADIFPDLAAIQRQFHHLIRLVPNNGMIVHCDQPVVKAVLDQGCWSEAQIMHEQMAASGWYCEKMSETYEHFAVVYDGQHMGEVRWNLTGKHNMQNALSAIAAARHVGVEPILACDALKSFAGVKRRMELRGEIAGINVYDDFAHHPTAIATTLDGLRAKCGDQKIIAVIEPRSNTMKQGVHKQQLLDAIQKADEALWLQPDNVDWNLADCVEYQPQERTGLLSRSRVLNDTQAIIDEVVYLAEAGTHVVIMSNGGFANIHQRLIDALTQRYEVE